MPHPEQTYHWSWRLRATPAALWPWVSDTDRFNRDCGYPAVVELPRQAAQPSGIRRLRTRVAGVPLEWDEHAFEWVAPQRFSVERRYHRGPVARMIVRCELTETEDRGTRLDYEIRLTPAGWPGRLAAPWSIGRRAGARMERVFRHYDELAAAGGNRPWVAAPVGLAGAAQERLAAISAALVGRGQPAALVARLAELVTTADDAWASRLRPYVVADAWADDRRRVLELFLHATRAGALDLRWELVCPHCRASPAPAAALAEVPGEAHCASCDTDFATNFAESLELTFAPNPAVRTVSRRLYCVGGPQLTPHILAQATVPAGGRLTLPLAARPGGYRLRTPSSPRQTPFRIAEAGAAVLHLELGSATVEPAVLATAGTLVVANPGAEPRLAVVEHLNWTDQAATAREVTSLQTFRDLFAREVLQPGRQIAAGTLTVVFTDLRDSTRLYREIGDAPAFGRVLDHFNVLKTAIAEEGGAVIKTMGDAVMATFPRPASAVAALRRAQGDLAAGSHRFALKAGLHTGPCLAINQNDRLDYFGTTVNTAARLCGQSRGTDLVLSETTASDPEVARMLAALPAAQVSWEEVTLKGLGDQRHRIRRLMTGGP